MAFRLAAYCCLLLLAPRAARSAPPPPPACTPALALVESNPHLSVLAAALRAADDASLRQRLSSTDAVLTLLAPSDAAYEASFSFFVLPRAVFLANTTLVTQLMRYQTLPGVALRGAGEAARQLPTLFLGKSVWLEERSGRLVVRSAGGSVARVIGQQGACAASVLLLDGIVLFS